ncbi:MAG: hypothetical protein FJY85_03270, partial [Deltaproteobacteria bacterium]|nr:hypothetical protein [Deltaproteobacteria bacterium]
LTALFLSNWTAIYDPVTVFMGTLGLALVVSRRHLLYYIFFPLAVLNKVTAYLNTGVFLAHEFGSMPNRRLFLHVLAQGLIWLGIMAALVYAFRDNPGNRADFMLFWNFRTFISAVSVYHSVYSILFFLLAAFLIGYRWRARPPMLRRMFVVTAVLFVPAVLLFGRASDELRVWYDLYPLVFLLSVGTVCDLLEVGMTVPSQMHSAEGKRE